MSGFNVSDNARVFLQGAGLGLQYRAQDIQRDQFAQRMEQDDRQFATQSTLARDRFALDQSQFDREVAMQELALKKDRITGRLWADKHRASLMPRGGIPIPGNGSIIFTPPGEDDDIHAMLDQVDSSAQAQLFSDIVKDRGARMRFRAEITAMEKGGYDKLTTPDSPFHELFQMIKKSRDPETGLKELWKVRDAIFQEELDKQAMQELEASGALQASGLNPRAAIAMGPKGVAQEAARNSRDTREFLVKQFEEREKQVITADEKDKPGFFEKKGTYFQDEKNRVSDAKLAAQRGLVTQDGWAVLNDGQPNAQGFIEFYHPSGRTYSIDPRRLLNGGIPAGDVAHGRAPRMGAGGGRRGGDLAQTTSTTSKPRKATQQDVNEIVSRVGKDKAKVLAEMKRLGLTAE